MTSEDPISVVESYLAAIAARDFPTACRFLAEAGFHYRSPIGHFEDRGPFADNMEAVGAILHNIRTVHRFREGNTISHVLDVTVNMTGHSSQRVVQIADVVDGRITRLEVIFDASALRRMIIENEDEGA